MPGALNGLARGFASFRKSHQQSPKKKEVDQEKKDPPIPPNANEDKKATAAAAAASPALNGTSSSSSGSSSASSRKRSPNTRTPSTVNAESIKSKRPNAGDTVSNGDNSKMETDTCATDTGGGGGQQPPPQISSTSSSTSTATTTTTTSSSSGYSSAGRSSKPSPHSNLSRGGSKSATENGGGGDKENRVPSSTLMASTSRGDVSPIPVIKNRPQRSFVGYVSPYEQFLRFTETDPKYRSEKGQGKILGMYKFCGEIGAGNFSKVKLGIHQLTKERVAIKIIEKSRVQEKMERMLSREVRSMEVLNHPNLIRLYEVMETGTKIYLISEWAPAGDLYSKVTLRGKLPEYDAKPIFRQILHAMLYMHGNGIIHRDLKAENVFFSSAMTCKVGDFGFSTTGYKGQLLTTFCGSPPYAAPELYRDEAYEGGPVDVWALGVLLYFMTEGRLPFIGTSIPNLKRNILNGEYMMSGSLSDELMDLIQKILQQRPSRRLTVAEMLVHPWLTPDLCISPEGGSEPLSKTSSLDSTTGTGGTSSSEDDNSCSSTVSARQTHCSIIRRDTTGKLFPTTKNRAICRSIPTKEQIIYKLVSPKEIQAYEILQDLGIPESMIEAHRSRGVRSYVIGMYRMILHKLEKGDEIDFAKFCNPSMNNSMTNFNQGGHSEISHGGHHHHHQALPPPPPEPPRVNKGPVKMNSNNSPIRLRDLSQTSEVCEGGEGSEGEEGGSGTGSKITGAIKEECERDAGGGGEEGNNEDLKDLDLNDIRKSLLKSSKEVTSQATDKEIETVVSNCQAVPSTTCNIL